MSKPQTVLKSLTFFFQSVYSDLVETWVTFRLPWRNRGLTLMILTWSSLQFSFLWTTTHLHCVVILVDSRHKNILLIYVMTHSSFRSVIVQPLIVCVVSVDSFTVSFYFIILWTNKIEGVIWTLSYLFKFDLWSIIWLPLEKVLWATKKECICTIFLNQTTCWSIQSNKSVGWVNYVLLCLFSVWKLYHKTEYCSLSPLLFPDLSFIHTH